MLKCWNLSPDLRPSFSSLVLRKGSYNVKITPTNKKISIRRLDKSVNKAKFLLFLWKNWHWLSPTLLVLKVSYKPIRTTWISVMTNQRRPSSPTASQRAALTSMTSLLLISILLTRGRCCIRMTSTWSPSPAPSSTTFIIKRKLRPPELIKDNLKDKPNKSQVSQVLDMGQFRIRKCVNLFFQFICPYVKLLKLNYCCFSISNYLC